MDAVTGALNKEWENGLCSCFGDFKLCCVTFILPCYTAGKIGDKVPGLSCITAGLLFLIPVVNLIIAFKLRTGVSSVYLSTYSGFTFIQVMIDRHILKTF